MDNETENIDSIPAFSSDSAEPFVMISSLSLGQNVERLRLEAGLSKTKFCLLAGISRPTLNKVEKGLANLKLQRIEDLADALNTTPWELIRPTGDDDEGEALFRELRRR